MTNAEMYQEVFGFPPDKASCPTRLCKNCPVSPDKKNTCNAGYQYHWWDEEYKGNNAVKIEVTEHHTFAKPDDVSDLDFPGISSEDK